VARRAANDGLVTIRLDTRDIERRLGAAARQIPFTISLAVNTVAKDAVVTVRKSLPQVFTVRSPWTAKGIQSRAATKKELVGYVGSVDPYIERQVEGGEKTGKDGGPVAVPVVGPGRARPKLTSKTPRSKWPRAMASKPGYFFGMPLFRQQSRRVVGVWKRMGPGGRTGLRLAWRMTKKVDVKARLPLLRYVSETVRARWPIAGEQAVKRALESAR